LFSAAKVRRYFHTIAKQITERCIQITDGTKKLPNRRDLGIDLTLFWTIEPLSDKSITYIANHQVEVLDDWGCGREVEVIHLSYGQAEID